MPTDRDTSSQNEYIVLTLIFVLSVLMVATTIIAYTKRNRATERFPSAESRDTSCVPYIFQDRRVFPCPEN